MSCISYGGTNNQELSNGDEQEHIKLEHVETSEYFDEVSADTKVKTQCPECGKYLANVNEHIKAVHLKIKNHQCDDCEYKSCFRKDLKKHMKAVHGKMLQAIEAFVPDVESEHFSEVGKVHLQAKETTQCPHCNKFLANLKEHIKAVHMKEKNYFCHLCAYNTLFKSDLMKHDELVHKKNKKSCQECGKQVANLHEHIRMVHKKEKNFKCNYCGYSCAKQSDMKKHSKNVHKVAQ